MWSICQSDPWPFIIRWRVYDSENNYVATFKSKEDAIRYVEWRD